VQGLVLAPPWVGLRDGGAVREQEQWPGGDEDAQGSAGTAGDGHFLDDNVECVASANSHLGIRPDS